MSERAIKTAATQTTTSPDVTFIDKIAATEMAYEDIQTALEEIASLVRTHLSADNAYIRLLSPENKLNCMIQAGDNSEDDYKVTASNALLDRVIADADSTLVKNAMHSDLFEGDPQFQRFNIETAICTPILTDDKPIGAIYSDSSDARAWDD